MNLKMTTLFVDPEDWPAFQALAKEKGFSAAELLRIYMRRQVRKSRQSK